MRWWRWPPWRREEPEVHEIEHSGETIRRARAETAAMGEEIYRRSREVQEGAEDLAEMIMRSMGKRAS